MKKFFLLAAVAGLTATPAAAVTGVSNVAYQTTVNTAPATFTTTKDASTWTAADVSTLNASQTKTLTSTQLKALDSSALQAVKVSDLDATTVKSLDTTTISKFTPVQRSELLQLQLADDSIKELTINRADLVVPNQNLIAVKKLPCVEFDDDVVEAPEFKVKYELNDSGLQTVALTKEDFKPFVSVKKYPELYKVAEWDPEVELINPLTNKVEYCTKYSNKCKLDDTLLTKYISTRKIRRLKLCDNVKVLPIIDMQCVGVKCGEGQECSNGCCEYQKTTTANVTLKPALREKYEIKDLELIAKPIALKDETAKLIVNDPVVEKEMLDTKILMEKATNASQAKLQTLTAVKSVK